MAESPVNYWAVSFSALNNYLRAVTQSGNAKIPQATRDEARRLLINWEEALALDPEDFVDGPRRAQTCAALRKRSIEVLTRVDRML
jgi:uncharacterized protein YmfQ (DUF2313 family)